MKTNIKALISELSVVEKIELLDCLYHELSGHGTDGDTELAHINTREAAVLKALGGSGTVNEITGLRQYGKGSPPPPPSSQTVEQKIPEEISPYIKDILAKGQAIQEQRTAEGYQPYQGPQLAEFTPEQQQAFTGISGLVGTGQQYFDPAARLTAAAAMQPTGQEVSQYMSPYMQQVVDIQKREAERQADVAGQQLASQAVTAGGFGGSRQAILEAEAARNLQTQLGDIQAKGLAAAYEDAQARLAAQRQRQLASGAQFAQMAPSALQTALQEQTALQQVGGLKQAQSQAALDIAKGQFEAEKTFPEQTLQQYSSLIRGYAMPPSYTSTTQTPAPSTLQQLAGLGSLGTGLYAASKMFKKGGKVGDGKGIASIIVKRKKGGSVVKLQQGGFPRLEGQFVRLPDGTLTRAYVNPEQVDRFKDFDEQQLLTIAKMNPEYGPEVAKELKLRKENKYDPIKDEAGPTGSIGSATSYDNFKPAATTAQAAASTSTDAEDSDEIDFSAQGIFKNFLTSSDEYRKAYTDSLNKMRESAKTDKELAGLNFIQKSLSAIASSRPGSIGAVLAESSPVVAEATSAALKADKEAKAELRAAELGEKKLGYEMEKELAATKLSIFKALQKEGMEPKDLESVMKIIDTSISRGVDPTEALKRLKLPAYAKLEIINMYKMSQKPGSGSSRAKDSKVFDARM